MHKNSKHSTLYKQLNFKEMLCQFCKKKKKWRRTLQFLSSIFGIYLFIYISVFVCWRKRASTDTNASESQVDTSFMFYYSALQNEKWKGRKGIHEGIPVKIGRRYYRVYYCFDMDSRDTESCLVNKQ